MINLNNRVLNYRLWCWAACLLVAGCSSLSTVTEKVPPLRLLPPSEANLAAVLRQSIKVTYKGHSQSFILVTRNQQDALKSVALLTTGQPLFQAFYDGSELTYKMLVPAKLPVKAMLAEMQFSLWPAESIDFHYALQDGWGFSIQQLNEQEQRVLLYQGKVVLNVIKKMDSISIDNLESGYHVDVRMLK